MPTWVFALIVVFLFLAFLRIFISILDKSAKNIVDVLQDDNVPSEESWIHFYSDFSQLILHRASHFGGFNSVQAESLHSIISAYSYSDPFEKNG